MLTFLGKLLASRVMRKLASRLVVVILREAARRTSNTLGNRVVDEIEDVLQEEI